MSWYHKRPDINWRNAEWMTRVRDQGNTKACWAVAVCDLVEMLHNRQNPGNRLHSPLSAQELIDNYPGSGHVEWAFDYIKTNGIAYEADYPWKGEISEKKERTEDQKIYWGISAVKRVDVFNKIEDIVEEHPVVGCFYLTSNFKNCQNSDIVNLEPVLKCDDGRTNESGHAMVIVGQGQNEYCEKYWHVKSTWGEGWGDEGYARLAKSISDPNRANYPIYYPLVHED